MMISTVLRGTTAACTLLFSATTLSAGTVSMLNADGIYTVLSDGLQIGGTFSGMTSVFDPDEVGDYRFGAFYQVDGGPFEGGSVEQTGVSLSAFVNSLVAGVDSDMAALGAIAATLFAGGASSISQEVSPGQFLNFSYALTDTSPSSLSGSFDFALGEAPTLIGSTQSQGTVALRLAIDNFSAPYTSPVPLPASMATLGLGLFGLWGVGRVSRRKRAA